MARRTAVLFAAAVAVACDVRRGAANDRPLPPPPPPAEPTGPTPLPAGRVPTTPEIAHLTLSIADGGRPDSVPLRRGRFSGTIEKDAVAAELLAVDGRALGDTGRAATGDLDDDGNVESVPVLSVRRGAAVGLRLVVVGSRDGYLGELAAASLGSATGVRQVALVGTRQGGDVRLTLAAAPAPAAGAGAGATAGALEVRWYRFTRGAKGGGQLRLVADTVGGAAAPLTPDVVPAAAPSHHHG